MLTPREIALIKSTAPVLESRGSQITGRFYHLLFEQNPELSNVFNMGNQTSGGQQEALANAVYAFAANVDNIGALVGDVERIAQKHASIGVKPEQFPLVGAALLQAIQEVVDPGAETIDAWAKGYGVLSNIFITREAELAQQKAEQEGGWRAKRPFVVAAKEKESKLVTSFYLSPKDGKKVAAYQPGQYIAVSLDSLSGKHRQIRQYSLSGSNKADMYRISVKREPNKDIAHSVSNYMHDGINVGDTLAVSNPFGDFHLQKSNRPAVLISGGVGITPMQGMLETLVAEDSNRDVHFVHGALDSSQHSFSKRLQELSSQGRVTPHIFYENVNENNRVWQDHHHRGRTDLTVIKDSLPLTDDADFYLCGPLPMMKAIYVQLKALDIAENHIFYEVFGPSKTLAS